MPSAGASSCWQARAASTSRTRSHSNLCLALWRSPPARSSPCSGSSMRRRCGNGRRDWASPPSWAHPGGCFHRHEGGAVVRAWLQRLRGAGVQFHMRHRFIGWTQQGACGSSRRRVSACSARACPGLGRRELARLGSDGAWVPLLEQRGVSMHLWCPPVRIRRAGWLERILRHPVRRSAVQVRRHSLPAVPPAGRVRRHGRGRRRQPHLCGLARSCATKSRHKVARRSRSIRYPPEAEQVLAEVAHPRGSRSLSSHLKSRLSLDGIKMALLHELLPKPDLHVAARWPARSRRCRSRWLPPGPSTKRSALPGVRFEALDDGLMLREVPAFCAGEMLDWEAPPGATC